MSESEFRTLGVMIDMSRNAVMGVEALKRYLSDLHRMGYNCAMLYTEDTFSVEGEPTFGYMRGGYTCDELRALDAYAISLGMELIPCIQTLAHLQGFVHWKAVPTDRDDILLVDDERTYAFLDKVLTTVRSCFSSGRIHIGMDEAWALGRGKFMDLHGYEKPSSIMRRHLDRVSEIVRRHGFTPMIWSDMLFYDLSPERKYYLPQMEIPASHRGILPQDVIPVYWDYYHTDEESYDGMLSNHEQMTENLWFAASAWGTHGFLPLNRYAISTIRPAINACRRHGVRDILMTVWGDDGAECSRYAVMPSLFYAAELMRGNDDEEKIKENFFRLFGVDMDAFLSLDDLNDLLVGLNARTSAAPKAVLYNDLFNGLLDCRIDPLRRASIGDAAEKWHAYAKKYRRWHYLFHSAACLADALYVKYDLGLRTRQAYQSGDRDALRALATNDYALLKRLVKRFARAFEAQWYRENRPSGFDVQEIRLGGLIYRIDSCRRRLLDYLDGRVAEIPELSVEIVTDKIPDGAQKTYGMMVTPNRLTHKVH